jgi:hypothetical protein
LFYHYIFETGKKAGLEVGGVQPKIRPIADKRPIEEGANPIVNVLSRNVGRPVNARRFMITPLGVP